MMHYSAPLQHGGILLKIIETVNLFIAQQISRFVTFCVIFFSFFFDLCEWVCSHPHALMMLIVL